jgi:hypothetical protein
MYETEWQINVTMTVFTTVRANSEEAANDAARDEIKRLMSQTDLQKDDYEVLEYDTYDFNRVEID